MLTQKEYQAWIEYVRENHFPLSDIVVDDINNWRNRSVLARALVRVKKYAPAIELFKSILDVEIHTEEKDCFRLSEVEDKVWCLQELALSVWRTIGNRSEALTYMEEALTLIATYPTQFNFLDRCEVWREIQGFIFFTSKGKNRK
ncbi:MAG: hypothetical protein ABFC84_04115 [Veillonellales bacterium]